MNDDAPKPAPDAEEKVDWSSSGSVLGKITDSISEADIKQHIAKHVNALAVTHGVNQYEILFLIDDRDEISKWHADRIYKAAAKQKKEKDPFFNNPEQGRPS